MSKKKQHGKQSNHDQYHVPLEDSFGEFPDDDSMNVVSGTECTGMVPTPPLSDGEADAYREIYDVPVEQNPVNEPYFPEDWQA